MTKYQLSFWRTRSGLEVDFILFGQDQFLAIEVKNHSTIHPQDLKGLEEFKADYPESTPILLYRGRERLIKNHVTCIPCDQFLMRIDPRNKIINLL